MSQQSRENTQSNVLIAVGATFLLVGAIGARAGTTNAGLFVVYIVLFVAGLVMVGAGRRRRDRKGED